MEPKYLEPFETFNEHQPVEPRCQCQALAVAIRGAQSCQPGHH